MVKTFPQAQRLREGEGWEGTANRKQSLCPLARPQQVDNNKSIFVDLSLHTSLSSDPSAMSLVLLSRAGRDQIWLTPRVSEEGDPSPASQGASPHFAKFNSLDFFLWDSFTKVKK